jgi:hypothetical protein
MLFMGCQISKELATGIPGGRAKVINRPDIVSSNPTVAQIFPSLARILQIPQETKDMLRRQSGSTQRCEQRAYFAGRGSRNRSPQLAMRCCASDAPVTGIMTVHFYVAGAT